MHADSEAPRTGRTFTRCADCSRRCGADRTSTESKAACGIGRQARIAAAVEGQIIFAGCSLACLYCPTPEANRHAQGQPVDAATLADLMAAHAQGPERPLRLVHASHVAAHVAEALDLLGAARPSLIWMSSGFDGVVSLDRLAGRIDAFQPEAKFGSDRAARMLAGVQGYVAANRAAIAEMLRQVGPARSGDAHHGVVVRHQVLPDGLAETHAALSWLPKGTPVQILEDYDPHHKAGQHPKLRRSVTQAEIDDARSILDDLGLVPWP